MMYTELPDITPICIGCLLVPTHEMGGRFPDLCVLLSESSARYLEKSVAINVVTW